MKFKLDENLGVRGAMRLLDAGHDVETVVDEGLTSAPDTALLHACNAEGRCLVTLDLGFANPLVYPPSQFAGIAVLRLPTNATLTDIDDAIVTLAVQVEQCDVNGRLWIVQRGRIREYVPDDETR